MFPREEEAKPWAWLEVLPPSRSEDDGVAVVIISGDEVLQARLDGALNHLVSWEVSNGWDQQSLKVPPAQTILWLKSFPHGLCPFS